MVRGYVVKVSVVVRSGVESARWEVAVEFVGWPAVGRVRRVARRFRGASVKAENVLGSSSGASTTAAYGGGVGRG